MRIHRVVSSLLWLTAAFFGSTLGASSPGTWDFVSGCQNAGCASVYGQSRFPAPGNAPGARLGSGVWVDQEQRLWMFGGAGFDTNTNPSGDMRLNDMWVYDISQKWFTWVSGPNVRGGDGNTGTPGVFSATSIPASRVYPVCWTSAKTNKLYMFGGFSSFGLSTKPGYTSDLWAFDPTSYNWAYFGGSTSQTVQGNYVDKGAASPLAHPAPRGSAASWVDANGKFWMFGGETAVNTFTQVRYLSDLWMFDPDISTWTWVDGPAMPNTNQAGVYGTKGVAQAASWPGARTSPMFWTDSTGHFWMFGGEGFDSQGHFGFLNDLWKYNPATKQWTWVAGSIQRDSPGVYGELRKVIPDGGNTPSARAHGYMYGQRTDSSGFNLWLIGGEGKNETYLNDVWVFDTRTSVWVWMDGSSSANQRSQYSNPADAPGGRAAFSAWISKDSLFVFGGLGYASNFGYLSDMWQQTSIPIADVPQGYGLIIGVSVSVFAVLAGAAGLFFWMRSRSPDDSWGILN